MDATTAFSAYGNRQDEFGYLSSESQAEIIAHAQVMAAMMNVARDAEIVKTYTDGSKITQGDVWAEIRSTRAPRPVSVYTGPMPLVVGLNASSNMFA